MVKIIKERKKKMNDFINNIISNTTFITVLSGVLVYILSQFVLEGIINPHKKLPTKSFIIGQRLHRRIL